MTKKIKEEVKLSVEKQETKIKLNDDAINAINNEINEFKKELDTKKYLISKDNEFGVALKQFISNEASWKFTESLGIIELSNIINNFISGKTKELAFDALALQACHYFLGKKEGIGLESAVAFKNLLKPVSEGIHRMNADKQKFEELEFRLTSLQQGVDPEKPEESFKN